MGVGDDLVTTKKSDGTRERFRERFRECFDAFAKSGAIGTTGGPLVPSGEAGPLDLFARENAFYHGEAAHIAAWRAEQLCQSPIERLFLWAILLKLRWEYESVIVGGGFLDAIDDQRRRSVGVICPQVNIGSMRVDFCVALAEYVNNESKKVMIVVECDGHDYHDKTKGQASRDRQRDREIQKRGMLICRFTGADLWADPLKCADEVLVVGKAEFERMRDGVVKA